MSGVELARLPERLPVDHLSASSIATFLKCPERWRRRYIEGEYEPSSPSALLGTAVHRAEGENYQQKIASGADQPVRDVLDVFSSEFDLARETKDVDWEDEKPGRVKDSGVRVVKAYHAIVAPNVTPVSVERKYELEIPGAQWTFEGYLDVETVARDGTGVDDLKVRGKTRGVISAVEAAADLQATANLFARRAEGNPADRFRFHNLLRVQQPTGKHLMLTLAHRTDEQLDAFYELLARVAGAIAHAAESGDWPVAAPGAWWCGQSWCGFWETCPWGGKDRSPLAIPGPQPIVPVTDSQVRESVARTLRRDGTTTAAKVAADLGIPVASASAKLTAAARAGRLTSRSQTKGVGRGKDRVVIEIAGPRQYGLPGAAAP